MRQLTCTAPGAVEWLEVPEPSIVDPADALVRPVAVARCEIDPFLVPAGPRGEDGFAIGHEAVVEVMAVGPEVEPEGVLHSVSYYGAEPMVPMPLGRLYTLGIDFRIGRAHSAALLAEVLDLVAAGRLHPEQVTTSVIDWEDAPDRYTDDTVKLVVSRTAVPPAADPGETP
jgi:threonine dehydrogenase-like Zn-dependent dehydrogenase